MSDTSPSSLPPADLAVPKTDPEAERLRLQIILHNLQVDRLRLYRGMVIDLAVVFAVVALGITKTINGDATVALLAALAGAGVVHKGKDALHGRAASNAVAGGLVMYMGASLLGLKGDA